MLGRDIAEIEAAGMTELGGSQAERGELLLEVEGIATDRNLRNFDMTLHRGEIVGLGGLLGSGRTEAARAVFGLDPLRQGGIRIKDAPAPDSPAAAIAAGIGFLPEDRKAEGIIPEMSVRENLTLAMLPHLTRRGTIRRAREREVVEHFIKALGIKTAHMDQAIRELSGGNQQKVMLARWLAIEPDLLLLDEPTRGVDVGAKREIQAIIRKFVDEGHGVVLISSEFQELVEGADRVVVLQDGRSVKVLENPGITEDALVNAIAQKAAAEAAA